MRSPLRLALFFLALLALHAPSVTAQDIMPLADVRPGMTGVT